MTIFSLKYLKNPAEEVFKTEDIDMTLKLKLENREKLDTKLRSMK